MSEIVVMSKSDFESVIEAAAARAVSEAIKRLPIGDQLRPAHVNQVQAAEMLGLSATTVGKLVRTGKLKLNGCGLVPITEIDRIIRH